MFSTTITITEGETAYLPCATHNDPLIDWYDVSDFESFPLTERGELITAIRDSYDDPGGHRKHYYLPTNRNADVNSDGTLTISEATTQQTGDYMCVTTELRSKIHLIVRGV